MKRQVNARIAVMAGRGEFTFLPRVRVADFGGQRAQCRAFSWLWFFIAFPLWFANE